MSSIWTNLLHLHGHVVPANLMWRLNDAVDPRKPGARVESSKATQATSAPAEKPRLCDDPACA